MGILCCILAVGAMAAGGDTVTIDATFRVSSTSRRLRCRPSSPSQWERRPVTSSIAILSA